MYGIQGSSHCSLKNFTFLCTYPRSDLSVEVSKMFLGICSLNCSLSLKFLKIDLVGIKLHVFYIAPKWKLPIWIVSSISLEVFA